MDDEIIFDGKPHTLNERYGYIANKIYENVDESKLRDYVDQQLNEYVEYLYLNDKKKVIDYLLQVLKGQIYHGSTDENYHLVFRPAHMVSTLCQFCTLALKFKLPEKDTNEGKDEPAV